MTDSLPLQPTLSPSGRLHLRSEADAPVLPAPVHRRVEQAFERGPGAGLLHLGAREVTTELPAAFAWLRDLGRAWMTALCALPDLEEQRAQAAVPAPADTLARLADAAPPMPGVEYLTPAILEGLWSRIEAAFREEIEGHTGTVQEYLQSQHRLWNSVGRVCLHLAENKRDPERPFAFLATFAHRVSGQGRVQHLPLGRALREGAGDRARLLTLLAPVQRAAKASELMGELVQTRKIYAPQRWDTDQAWRFLQEIPLLESQGLIVRLPQRWRTGRPARPQVRVTVGDERPSRVGEDALLDFKVNVCIDGDPLTDAEIAALLASEEGLVLLRGQWIEIDPEGLGAVLDRWRAAEQAAATGGLTLLEGMRLAAGAHSADAEGLADTPQWSEMIAGEWLRQTLGGLRDPSGLHPAEPGPDFRATLRPYQQEGLRWLALLTRLNLGACLADDMGLGKTIQVLALLSMDRPRPRASLLVVPTSLIANWQAEIARFSPSLRVRVAHSSQRGPRIAAPELVITTYGTLHRLPEITGGDWDMVILDEAQAIKNPGARRSRAARALNGRVRIALTGTPMENRLGDLWSLLDFLNPGLLGNRSEFAAFCKRLDGDYAPLRRLISPYILRRLKSDPRIIDDLPDKTEVKAFCGLTRAQAALYAQSVEALREQLEQLEGIARRGVVLGFLMRFKQLCDHPSLWLHDDRFAPEDSGKLTRLREICEQIASRQEKVLVFTQFRQMIAPLCRFLEGVFGRPGVNLHGGTSVRQRADRVERFQQEDGPPFFVLSLRAGGTGLNLTAASHVIHFDRWWNPAVENQATDRAYRIGQRRNVLVHKFICRGTIEERIDEMIADKAGLVGAVVEGDRGAALTELSDERLLEMVALDIHSALR